MEPTFASSLKTGFFDTDGYIILQGKYSKEDYEAEYGQKPLGEFVRELVGLDISDICIDDGSRYVEVMGKGRYKIKEKSSMSVKAQKALEEYMLLDQNQIDNIVNAMALAGLDHHTE